MTNYKKKLNTKNNTSGSIINYGLCRFFGREFLKLCSNFTFLAFIDDFVEIKIFEVSQSMTVEKNKKENMNFTLENQMTLKWRQLVHKNDKQQFSNSNTIVAKHHLVDSTVHLK